MSDNAVNSIGYWDHRFDGDWEDASGREQSRFFGALALRLLPAWLAKVSARDSLTWCDWGCALGDGTNELAGGLPDVAITGIDFSEVAIESARARYPAQSFRAVDWIAGEAPAQPDFDVVFSSNTLEHFHRPMEVLEKVAAHARCCVIMLLPYRERNRIVEHHASFTPENLPAVLPDGKVLVHTRVRDTREDSPCFWGGEQVLAVWADPRWVAGQRLRLADIEIDAEPDSPVARVRRAAIELAGELGVSAGYLAELPDTAEPAKSKANDILHGLVVWNAAREGMALANGPAWQEDQAARDARDSIELQAALQALEPALTGSRLLEELKRLQATNEKIQAQYADLRQQAAAALAQADAQRQAAQEDRQAARGDREAAVSARRASDEEFLDAARARREDELARQEAWRNIEHEKALVRHQLEMAAGLCESFAALYGQQHVVPQRLAELVELADAGDDVDWQQRYQDEALRNIAISREVSTVYASSSWRVTRPLRFLRRMVSKPGSTLQDLRRRLSGRIPEDRPGKVGSALRFSKRTLRDGRLDPADRTRLKQLITPPPSVLEGSRPADYSHLPPLSPVQGELADVYVWAVIDWNFRIQRPQHLAMALAEKGHRVFYISNNFADKPAGGFNVEALNGSGRLFQVNLNLPGSPQIYHAMPDAERVEAIRQSLATLLGWTGSVRCTSFVQHPFWLEPAQCLPNAKLVYDCMDHHGGFEDNAESIMGGESELIRRADLLVVTSQWLHDELRGQARDIAMVRNATEYSHFCARPDKVFADPQGRRVIGYYGAIAEWFDVDLLRKVALENPAALVLMVGRDTANVAERVADIANIQFVGEVPYAELPYWLYGFDVCLLPFRVIPLTLATNPVKVYEYLSAGKPVVSVDLPELSQFEGLVRLAGDAGGFVEQVKAALAEPVGDAALEGARRDFAARQTWLHRAEALDEALGNIAEPLVSIIVLTYNNLDYTRQCLHSLEVHTDYDNVEVIVVDNASTDGSPEYLADWASRDPRRTFIANEANLGFSAGNNVGLRVARGEYLVVLNNDTYVTPGWLRSLRNQLRRHGQAGLAGPVTNNIGNEAKIEIAYDSMDEMVEKAGRYTRRHAGKSFPIETAAFFCVMLSREAYERVGGLDEQFGVGFFEDDDYCRRLDAEGLGRLCAEDVFVHHQLSASFNKLKAETKQALFEKNKALYEAKWGPWIPHGYRPRDASTH